MGKNIPFGLLQIFEQKKKDLHFYEGVLPGNYIGNTCFRKYLQRSIPDINKYIADAAAGFLLAFVTFVVKIEAGAWHHGDRPVSNAHDTYQVNVFGIFI